MRLASRARHVAAFRAAFRAAMGGGQLARGGAVAGAEAATASGGGLVPRMSLGLLPGEDGAPSGAMAVVRKLGDAAVEFVARGEGDA